MRTICKSGFKLHLFTCKSFRETTSSSVALQPKNVDPRQFGPPMSVHDWLIRNHVVIPHSAWNKGGDRSSTLAIYWMSTSSRFLPSLTQGPDENISASMAGVAWELSPSLSRTVQLRTKVQITLCYLKWNVKQEAGSSWSVNSKRGAVITPCQWEAIGHFSHLAAVRLTLQVSTGRRD